MFVRDLKAELSGNSKQARLKTDAAPTIFTHKNPVLIVQSVTKMKTCDQCPKTFIDVAKLTEHLQKVHKRIKTEDDGAMETFHQCRMCDVKFQRYEDLEKHCVVHAADNSRDLSPLISVWKSTPEPMQIRQSCVNIRTLVQNNCGPLSAVVPKPNPPPQPWKNVDHNSVCMCACAKIKTLKTIPSYKHQKLQAKYRKIFLENKLLKKKLAAAERELKKKTDKANPCRSGSKRSGQSRRNEGLDDEGSDVDEETPSTAKKQRTQDAANKRNFSIDVENSACFYCSELSNSITEHYFEKHANKPRVSKILTLQGKGKVKIAQYQLTLLCNHGSNKHNKMVVKTKNGALLVSSKSDVKWRRIEDFMACPRCKGWYLSSKVNNHVNRSCVVTKKREKGKNSASTIPRLPKLEIATHYVRESAGFQKVLSKMVDDEITQVVKKDELILNIGEYFYTKDGLVGLHTDSVSKQMRAAACFLLKVREISKSELELESCFKIELVKTVKEAVKILAGQKSDNGDRDILKHLGSYLEEWVSVKIARSGQDPTKIKESEKFLSRIRPLILNSSSRISTGDEDEEDDDDDCDEDDEEEEDDSEIDDKSTEASNEGKKKSKYAKLSVCLFCGKHVEHKIAKHYRSKHMSEPAMKEACSKTGKNRKMAISLIRAKGNFKHNINILKANRSDIIVACRPNNGGVIVASEYIPCPYCYSFIMKKHFTKHLRMCFFKPEGDSLSSGQNKARLMWASALSLPKGVEEAHKFLSTLRSKRDILGQAMMKDKLLISFGKMLVDELGPLKIDDISQRMRQLAQFTITLNEHRIRRIDLHEIVSGRHFESVISAVKIMTRFSEGKKAAEICGKPDLALRMGHNLSKLAFIKFGLAMREDDANAARDAEIFSKFMSNSWHDRISSVALNSFKTVKLGKLDLIPLTSDLMTLKNYLTESMTDLSAALKETSNREQWNKLCESVLCSLSLVNWHRGTGRDLELLSVTSYKERPCWVANQQQCDFTQLEKHICSRMDVVELPQQQHTKDYLLIPPLEKSAIDVLLSTRTACNIPETNSYVFADKDDDHFNVSAILKSVGDKLELTNMEQMYEKDFKRFISTVNQVTILNTSEIQWLFNQLAEHIQILDNFVKLPKNVADLAKVCKLFLATDSGFIEKYRGQSFQDLHLNEIGLLRYEDVIEEGENESEKETTDGATSRDSEDKDNSTDEHDGSENKGTDGGEEDEDNLNKDNMVEDLELEENNISKKSKRKKLRVEEDEDEMDEEDSVSKISPKKPHPEEDSVRKISQRKPHPEEDENWSDETDAKRWSSVGTIKRERWTTKENTLFWNSFQKYIQAKRIPSGRIIAEKARNLPGRTVAQIRTRIHNFISGKQKFQK